MTTLTPTSLDTPTALLPSSPRGPRLLPRAQACEVDGNSDWQSFLNGKAVANRLAFCEQLGKLLAAQQSGDGLAYVRELYALSARLRRPCLRLRILQQVHPPPISADLRLICTPCSPLHALPRAALISPRPPASAAGARPRHALLARRRARRHLPRL